MASKVAGLMCFILCVNGAALEIKPPSKQVQTEPARKLLAQAFASGPMNTAVGATVNGETQKHREPLLPPELIIIVPPLFTILVAIIYLFCRRNPNNAELFASAPNNVNCHCSIIGTLFSAS